jgi:2-amino-4-hydroxy-6-hydroxymethyldihydropteridine diphosphokinase
MPDVYIGAGSNVEPREHLRNGLISLADRYGVLRLSPVYENSPVGFEGDDFLNMVIGIETEEPVEAVAGVLTAIEAANGRVRGEAKFGPRTLDLDLLLYGDLVDPDGAGVPRDEILRYGFVLKPLADLCPEHCHPVLGKTYDALWAAFDKSGTELRRRPLDLSVGTV